MRQIINIIGLLVVLNFFSLAQDTLIVEEKPVPLNFTEVMQSLSLPKDAPDFDGKIYVKILIGLSGDVDAVGDVTGPEAFHEEVTKAARKFIFAPIQVNGHPVRVLVSFPFAFRIKK